MIGSETHRRALGARRWLLADGRTVNGCRDLGCYSATLGAFCSEHAATLKPTLTENAPLRALRYHVTGVVDRGEGEAITEQR